MSRPVLLDLFCGAGGAAMGYHQAGFDVVGVDINPQPRYPFEFIQADATKFALNFDWSTVQAVHASPPCQDHTPLTREKRGTGWMLDHTIQLLELTGKSYVIENVPGADMPGSLVLCGSEFGLRDGDYLLRRHRQFLSNVFLYGAGGCTCAGERIIGVYGDLSRNNRRITTSHEVRMRAGVATARRILGCPWMEGPELSQAIPPAYTRFIGEQLLAHLEVKA